MNILLCADESAGYQAFNLIINSNHTLSTVIAPPTHAALARATTQKGILMLPPSRLKEADFADWIANNKVDVLINVNLLYIIHPDIIDSVSFGAFNLHPGKLPSYAGLNTPSWAIYNREKNHTVTLHRINAKVDTGNIAYSINFPIESNETGLSLSIKCAKKGMYLISKLLKDLSLSPSSIPNIPQNLGQRKLYLKNDIPHNSFVNWENSSDKIDAFFRAFNYHPFKSPWGFPKTTYNGDTILISNAYKTNEFCHYSEPGIIGQPLQDFVPVATADCWFHLKTCLLENKHVPAHQLLSKGHKLT